MSVKMNEELEKLNAAWALNLWTVSVSQIIDYNDVNVLKQEYDNIINNINLDNMPLAPALLDIIKEIMEEITNILMIEGDRLINDKQYQHRMKNAVWNAIPNIGAIFATSNPIAMGMTLATQIGIGYMNYRRTMAEIKLETEKEKWEITKNRMQHLHRLQKKLFETAWKLRGTYNYPDKYRLTPEQIDDYNQALMEANPVRRYKRLAYMQENFLAYPHFWYQIGSTVNYIYRNANSMGIDKQDQKVYYDNAMSYFERFDEINKCSILRKDIFTSSWALEFFELLYPVPNNTSRCFDLIQKAVDYSGQEPDVLELCAISYLRLRAYDKAILLLDSLVNTKYNLEINTQLLSALYIYQMYNGDKTQAAAARFGYNQLRQVVDEKYRHYIMELPPEGSDLTSLRWIKDDDIDAIVEKQEAIKRKKESSKELARRFYSKQQPCCVVYSPELESVAIDLIELMNTALTRIGLPLTPIRVSVKDYKCRQTEYDAMYRIIFLGDSKEAKLYYKNDDSEWDYEEMGIRIKQYSGGKVAVILASTRHIDDTEFTDHMARKKRNKWRLPDIKKMSSKEMNLAQYQLAIHEYLQLNNALILD